MRSRDLAGLVLVLALTAATGCRGPNEPGGSAAFRNLPADMIMVGMKQHVTNNGLKRATLTGDSAYIFEDSSVVKVKGVDLVIFDALGKQNAHLTSTTGDFDSESQGMIARGNVVLITNTGRRIETEELHYDPNTKRIWSNVHTVLIENGKRSTGDGFTADDQFTNVTVRNPKGSVQGLKIEF